MTIREVRVTDLPRNCPYCGDYLTCETLDDNWRACLHCEVVFRETHTEEPQCS